MKRIPVSGMLMSVLLIMAFLLLPSVSVAITGRYDLPSISTTNAYTYDSDIDPKIIKQWNMVFMEPFGQRLLMAYKNPDIAAEIPAGLIVSEFPGVCVAFSYYKSNKAYLFIYNRATKHYVREKNQKIVEFMKQIFQRMLGHVGI